MKTVAGGKKARNFGPLHPSVVSHPSNFELPPCDSQVLGSKWGPTQRQLNTHTQKNLNNSFQKNKQLTSQNAKSLHTSKTLTLAKVGLAKVGFDLKHLHDVDAI